MTNTEPPVFKLFGKTIQTDDNPPIEAETIPTEAESSPPSSSTTTVTEQQQQQQQEAARAANSRALACPRCKSKETKFCYFNNYNVNQPRHFCKACHRYWTAGGTLRNVPVGAGRRKNRAPPTSAPRPDGAAGGVCLAGVEEVADRWMIRS